MKRAIMLGLVFLFLVAFAIGDTSNMNVTVTNMVPSVLNIKIEPDDNIAEGIQINKTGDNRLVIINATVRDLNGIKQIDYVKAFITGPSLIEESPIALGNLINLSSVIQGIYNGSFVLNNSDILGNYTINVTVNDSLSLSWSSVIVEYIGEEEIVVYFNKPKNNTKIPGEYYLLNATANKEMARANFSIALADWEDSTPFCNTTTSYDTFCENNTPGTEFTCLADFSQNTLFALDTYICLKAEVFDDGGYNATAYALVNVDNIPPGNITDLTATPSGTNGYIDLSWTAPGENNMSGTVSDYIIKIATNQITTEAEFNSAQNVQGACNVLTPSSPGTTGSCTQTDDDLPGYEQNSSTVYYYAIKSVDDVGQNSSLSNSPGSVAPYHDVIVDSIACVNAKNGYVCNDTTADNTNYLYDILNVSGNITNAGNLDESVTVELKRSGSLVDSKEEEILKGEKKLVIGLKWNATISYPPYTNLELLATAGSSSSSIKHSNIKVWSVEEISNISWFSSDPDNNPPPSATSNDLIIVLVKVWKLAEFELLDLYDIPTYINIKNISTNTNTNFSINSSRYSDKTHCDVSTGNKTCFVDISPSIDWESHFWKVNPLPKGNYNITVKIGNNPLDQIIIDRSIEITDP